MSMLKELHSEKSVRYLKGIGPKKYESLKRLGVETVRDLCFFFPRRYEDRSHFQKIAELKIGSFATLSGTVKTVTLKPLKHLKILEVWLQDDTGVLPAIWFNQPYLKNNFQVGMPAILSGKIDLYQSRLQMVSPEYELIDLADNDPIHTGRITPIYPLTEGLFQRSLRVVMNQLMHKQVEEEVREYLSPELIKLYHLLPRLEAVRHIHFPPNYAELERARTRLIFDEFFLLELKLLRKLNETKMRNKSIPFEIGMDELSLFRSRLPFPLTSDQERAISEASSDVARHEPMHRLLQGEVGSGKTVVAAFLLQLANQNHVQAALLAPTEILAEQHAATLRYLLAAYPAKIKLLTASVTADEREEILTKLAIGEVDVLIGTHAVLQESVNFKRLGLVIIDEQHKFGVRQRAKLLTREPRPHLLVMSATPIPRTLGLTLYGDLDISTIRQLPNGRRRIATYRHPAKERHRVLLKVLERIAKNEQAYILFPIIEETEKLDLQAAKQEYERLKREEFRSIPIGLIHGRLPKEERDSVMHAFRNGTLKVLVATSVVEVGVDNPNATVMVIENADRFGLSQLHQIRGRIGRGKKESVCYLIADPKTEQAERRLDILTQTMDGFTIAEEDLKLRGPGEFFGVRQSGLAPFKIADMIRDASVLLQTREEAKRILEKDPLLELSEHHSLRLAIENENQSKAAL